jgi:hypothetical protein
MITHFQFVQPLYLYLLTNIVQDEVHLRLLTKNPEQELGFYPLKHRLV